MAITANVGAAHIVLVHVIGLAFIMAMIIEQSGGAWAGRQFRHQSCRSNTGDEPYPAPPQFEGCRLQYYVQVLQADSSLNQSMLPALNTSFTGLFGHGELFAFNVTSGPERNSSLLGFARGFTIDSSYRKDLSGNSIDLIEVEYITFDDGHFKGTFQIQAEVKAQRINELAIVGGTGSFRGARGYGFATRLILDGDYRLFHHDIRFLH